MAVDRYGHHIDRDVKEYMDNHGITCRSEMREHFYNTDKREMAKEISPRTYEKIRCMI